MTTLTLLSPNAADNPDQPSVYVDYEDVFSTLVANKGHVQLTCEQLSRRYNTQVTNTHILEAVKDRLPELKQYMEALAVLELFSLMPRMYHTIEANISSLEGAEAVEAFMDLHKLISAKVDTTKIDVNVQQQMALKLIPRDLLEVWAQLESTG